MPIEGKRKTNASFMASNTVTESPQLRAHLNDIGLELGLRHMRPTRMAGVPAIVQDTPVFRTHKGVVSRVLVGTALVLSVVVAGIKLWPAPIPVVPDALLGEWVTQNPQYSDRRLAFTPFAVVIGTGEKDEGSVYPIVALRAVTTSDTTKITVVYNANGDLVELNAALLGGVPAKLVFQQPSNLTWVRPGAVQNTAVEPGSRQGGPLAVVSVYRVASGVERRARMLLHISRV